LELYHSRNDQSFKSLIDLGTQGHFPLFDLRWLGDIRGLEPNKLTNAEKLQAKKIIKRLAKHKTLERKKTILISLAKNERQLFIRAFLNMVEGKIIDLGQDLH
jgi:hypothetical protein